MPQGCIVPNCNSRYGSAEKVSMYRFPLTKPNLVEKWLEAIQKPNWVPSKNSRICCHHFEEDCFWTYNGRSALTPFAVPTKFNDITSGPDSDGQHFLNASQSWYLPSENTNDGEFANITRDYVYIKTEPDLYLSENDFTVKDEPQSDTETDDVNSSGIQIKVEDGWENCNQRPLPIFFPTVKNEIKEEPEDNTYSLPPSNFARLSSQTVLEESELNVNTNFRHVKKTAESKQSAIQKQTVIQHSPKKPRSRKRRRVTEEGVLSDHTYVKLKLGGKVRKHIILNHKKESACVRGYSDVSIQCGDEMFLQNDVQITTQRKIKSANSTLKLSLEEGERLCSDYSSRKSDTGLNKNKDNGKTRSSSNAKRISKFPSVTFSNRKCKSDVVLDAKQRKYTVCKKLFETFKKDFDVESDEKEVSGEEDFNKENTIISDSSCNAAINRELPEEVLKTLDTRPKSGRNDEYRKMGIVKKYNSNIFNSIALSKDNLNKLCTSLDTEQNFESSIKDIISENQKFAESFVETSTSNVGQTFVPTSVSQSSKNNSLRRKQVSGHRKKKKLNWSHSRHKNFIASIKVKQAVKNKTASLSLASISNGKIVHDSESRSCSPEFSTGEETFVKEEVTESNLCVLCEEVFSCQESLRVHVATHCKQSAYACVYCAKTFEDEESRRSHVRTHVLHKCVLCCAELPSKSALCEHVLSHFGGTVLKCEHCPKTFYGTKLYEEHQLLHAVVSEYVCKTCKKVLSTEIEYLEHTKSHLKESVSESQSRTVDFVETSPVKHEITPIKVENETVEMRANCVAISKNIIRGGLVCAICNKFTFNESEYKKHVLGHKNHKTSDPVGGKQCAVFSKRVKCMLCGRKFKSENVLRKHILVHTGEIQQTCGSMQYLDR